MLIPKYTITNSILKNIGIIEAAKEVILSAPLIPAWEGKLRRQALERTIYFSVRMEGSKIMDDQIADILDGKEVEASEVDIVEVENVRDLDKYIRDIASSPFQKPPEITEQMVEDIHTIAMERLMPPERLGKLRESQIVVRNAISGEISYSPPPAAEVEYLMEDLLNFLNTDARDIHPVIKAAIAQLEIYRIHPFIEGNPQVGRALSNLILKAEDYGLKDWLSIEEYFDSNLNEYYSVQQRICNLEVMDTFERDLTDWLEYFTRGVATEMTALKEIVRKISTESRAKDKLGESVTLTERQMIIMDYLHRHKEMRNKDFRKIFPDHSDDTVLREIKFLKQKGLVKKIGGTKSAKYVATDLKE